MMLTVLNNCFLIDDRSKSQIHPYSGALNEYRQTFLAHGVGAEQSSNSHAKQSD